MAATALFDDMKAFLDGIQATKQAAAKKAEEYGQSTHPTETADGNTSPAKEGPQTAFNTAKIKKDIQTGGIDSSPDNKTGDQAEVQKRIGIGMNATPTGEDPSTEKDFKDKQKDPGTSSKATFDDGEKYASMTFDALYKLSTDLTNSMLADISATAVTPKTAAAPSQTTQEKVAAAQVGAQVAQAATATPEQVKSAEDEAKAEYLMGVIKEAQFDADLLGPCLENFYKGKQQQALNSFFGGNTPAPTKKAAEGDPEDKPEPKEKKEEGEPPPDAASGGGAEAPPGDMGGLGALMGGGGGGGAVDGSAAPPGGGPPGPGGGGEQDAIHQLIMALVEMGVTPEMIIQELSAAGGGGGAPPGGGMPPGGGGMPPPMAAGMPAGAGADGGAPPAMPPMPPQGMTAQASDQAVLRQNLLKLAQAAKIVHAEGVKKGTFRFQDTKTAQERIFRDSIQKCIREICSRR